MAFNKAPHLLYYTVLYKKRVCNTVAVAMKYSLVCLTILGITITLVLQYFLEKYVYLKVSFQDFTSFEDTLLWSFPH